jgi:hypothetical protein
MHFLNIFVMDGSLKGMPLGKMSEMGFTVMDRA